MSFKHSDSQLGTILLLWDIRQCLKTFLVNHNWEGITGRGQGGCEHPPTQDISSVLTHTQQRINRPNMLIVMMLRNPDLGRDIFEEKCKYWCMYTYVAISLKKRKKEKEKNQSQAWTRTCYALTFFLVQMVWFDLHCVGNETKIASNKWTSLHTVIYCFKTA